MIIDKKRIKGLKVFKVKRTEEYMYVWTNEYTTGNDGLFYDGFATLQNGDILPSCHVNIYDDYLREECRVVTFKQLPTHIQTHLRNYIKWTIIVNSD